jgi:hypothetical protein
MSEASAGYPKRQMHFVKHPYSSMSDHAICCICLQLTAKGILISLRNAELAIAACRPAEKSVWDMGIVLKATEISLINLRSLQNP